MVAGFAPAGRTALNLPPIQNPERYAGLFVYDFGTHVSVGYTATEVGFLRASETHCGGTAYEIYRVTDEGGFELRGVLDERLTAQEAICFLRADAAKARRDYDAIRAAAGGNPIPCAVELVLARLFSFDPPNVTALCYQAAASAAVSGWLSRYAVDMGDRVVGGIDVQAELPASNGDRIASCELPTLIDHTDRSADEVFATVSRSVQR